jgi:hypothetical protein
MRYRRVGSVWVGDHSVSVALLQGQLGLYVL